MSLKHYLMEIFEPTILFGTFSSLVGVSAAWHYGNINPIMAALAVIGVVLLHISVNLIDDYEDYSSGLDKDTVKTKFSGGSFLVTKKLIKLRYVLYLGIFAFLLAALIGLYLIYSNILLLPFALVGGITVLLYAKFLSKVPFLSEPLTAINFALISLGSFIAAGGSLSNLGLFAFAAAALGIQVGLTVLVNYMPDRIPDRKHGRRSVGIMIDSNKGIAVVYILFEALSFLLIIFGVMFGAIPAACLLVLLTIPVVWSISCGISSYKNPKSFEKVMGNGVLAELAFIIILFIAFA